MDLHVTWRAICIFVGRTKFLYWKTAILKNSFFCNLDCKLKTPCFWLCKSNRQFLRVIQGGLLETTLLDYRQIINKTKTENFAILICHSFNKSWLQLKVESDDVKIYQVLYMILYIFQKWRYYCQIFLFLLFPFSNDAVSGKPPCINVFLKKNNCVLFKIIIFRVRTAGTLVTASNQ